MASELLQRRQNLVLPDLPPGFHTGVTEDGRVFFINDLDRTTSWLHPLTQDVVETGLNCSNLPKGWQSDTTDDGRIYFVDHNRGFTTFENPWSHQQDVPPQGTVFHPPSPHSPQQPLSPQSKEPFKRGTFKQRSVKAPSAKRNPNAQVIKSGWLHRLESSGLSKAWKKRWVVLADFALFLYKDHEETSFLNSILLPSYHVNPCMEEDGIKRNFVFKVEHENTKTVYLATDDSPELVSWMSLLRQSAMMDGNAGFQREQNNNYQQHYPPSKSNMDPVRDQNQNHSLPSYNPEDIMDNNPNLSRSSLNPSNVRPHTQQNRNFDPTTSNRYSNASMSASYQGFHDPSLSPVTPPTEPRPRIGGVYPFTLQMGQRWSYVSQGGSNRNSLANAPIAPLNVPQSYAEANRPNHPSEPIPQSEYHQSNQRTDHPVQGRYANNRYPNQQEQFAPPQLKDGFEPDSVRSSLAQSDLGRSFQNPPNRNPMEREHAPEGLRNGSVTHYNAPSNKDRYRDQQRDSYSDSQGNGHKQLHQWDRNLPAMEAESMRNISFDNLLYGSSVPQGATFNSRSKSYDHFSQAPKGKIHNNSQNEGSIPNGNNFDRNEMHGRHADTAPSQWSRPHADHQDSKRTSYTDHYRGQGSEGFNPTPGQRLNEYPGTDEQEFRASFKTPNEHPPIRKGDSYGPMEFHDNRDRHSQSSLVRQNRDEPFGRGAPRSQEEPRSYESQSASNLHSHYAPQDSNSHSSPSHTPQNSFNSYDHQPNSGQFHSNAGQFHPDQRWKDNSFSSHPARDPPHQTGNDIMHQQQQQQQQQQQNPNQSLRSKMHLDLGSQPDSSYPNPHTYVNFPSRKPYEGQTTTPSTQYAPDHQHRHNTSHDLAQNLSHDSSMDQPPARPPYPASVREQIVQEIAQVQTPSTQKDFLTSNELNRQRMQQPSYFQYPSPRDQHQRDQHHRDSPQDLDRSRLSRVSQRSLEASLPTDAPASRLSSASHTSQASKKDQRDYRPSQETQAKRNMMDPEAQNMRVAFERVHSLRMSPDRALKRPDEMFRPSQTSLQLERSPVKPPRVLSQVHRGYRSQDELDTVGEMPPPKGSYYKIRDDSEDLYQRGSAFRPPSSLSGSQIGTDSLQRMKKFSNIEPLNIPIDCDNENKDGLFRKTGDIYNLNHTSPYTPYDNLNGTRAYSSRVEREQESADEQISEGHPFFDPYGTASKLQQEKHLLKLAAPPKRTALPIHTVKEDPNMPDKDVLETDLQKVAKKNPLQGPRLRMSICAGDLIGKTHDELVLLLIQLRRNQSALDKTRFFYKQQMEQRRNGELEFRRQMHQFGEVQDGRLHDIHQSYAEARGQMDEIEKKLEVYRPIINLLDNMVTMGSLYGGDNLMLASQYRKHLLRPDQYQAPRKMLEFSRQHQEDRLIQETNEEIKQLSAEEIDLEEKIDRLNEIDRLLQEQSFKVSSFKEDKELMERALTAILHDQSISNPYETRQLTQQQRLLEKEISRLTQMLAEASKELEETTAENNKLEHEVALLRTKVHGELTRSKSAPSLASENVRTKMKMEKELAKVQDMMQGLNQQGAKLSQAMNTLRRSSSGTQLAALGNDESDGLSLGTTYLQTDLDSGEQVDLAKTGALESLPVKTFISHQRQNASEPEDWNTDEGDENTRKFFGLGPKDKVKGPTVRDVKRLSEARREKRKDEDDYGEEIKLRVSNVDTEDTSFIQARIAGELKSKPAVQPWDPLYENLPRYGSMPALPGNQSASSSRRSSIILMAPKPFTPYQDKTARPFKSELSLDFVNGGNGFSQNKPKLYSDEPRLNEQYSSQDVLKLDGQDYYQTNASRPVESLPDGQHNGNYELQQDPLTASYSEGQFHAKPTTIQPANQLTRSESPLTQDVDKGLPQEPRFEGNSIKSAPFNGHSIRPWEKPATEKPFNYKKMSRGRHLTISSSQPFKMETNSLLSPTLHSSAGDLILNRTIDDVPDIVKSSQTKVDQIDEDMIDREILYVPDKVLIPERYDAEADAEELTEEDVMRRREKAERIRRVLTSQSVLSMSQPDISQVPNTEVHSRVEHEKKARAHFLALNQELAHQVTQQSKKQAAERRKTWSGAQFADAKKLYEQEQLNSSASPLRSPDVHRKRAGITMRDI